jgi:hypothetical protein
VTPLLALALYLAPGTFPELTARVIADLREGRPLVVDVHVPLCDNDVLRCGNARLGDGDRPEGNLYWATTEGMLGWFKRRWTAVPLAPAVHEELDLRVWRRDLPTPAAWQKAGAPPRYRVYVIARAWRGEAIAAAFERYARDLAGVTRGKLTLADGTVLATGGDAQIVAWVGHNHLMDREAYPWASLGVDPRPRGGIAIACHTAAYMEEAPGVPLLQTRDYLYANGSALEGAVLAFASGGDFAAIRRGAAKSYADSGKKSFSRVLGAFSNPADKRWGLR